MAILAFSSNNIFDSTSAGRALLTAADASAQRTLLGLSSSSAVSFQSIALSGQSLTGSTATSVFDATATWNTTGTPIAWKLNVTDTASGGNPLLIDLQANSSSRFDVTAKVSATYIGQFSHNGLPRVRFSAQSSGAAIEIFAGSSNSFIGFGTIGSTVSRLYAEDASNGIIGQRNGVNPQTFRVYNTFTDISNYERAKIAWSSNVLQIGTEEGGTGTARAMALQTDGTTRVTVSSLYPQISLGTDGNAAILFSFSGSSFTSQGNGRGFSIFSSANTAGDIAISLTGDTVFGPTAGVYYHTYVYRLFAPTSGTTSFDLMRLTASINQTGGANGITRGIYVAPALTAAADWRSIETSNNTGYAFYGAGTAPSYFGGNVGIGVAPSSFKLHIRHTGGDFIRLGISAANADTLDGGISWYTNEAVTADYFGGLRLRFQGGSGANNRQMQFLVGDLATPKVVITGQGFVGVGTNTPDRLFIVTGSNATGLESALFYNSNTTSGTEVAVRLGVFNGTVGLSFRQSTNVTGPAAWASGSYDSFIQAGQNGSKLHFAAGGNTSPQVTLSGGNLGIGTTSPKAKIHTTDALIAKSFLSGSYYHYSNGFLIRTDIAVSDNRMFELTIEGNSYNDTKGPIFARVQAYNFVTYGTIITTSAFSTDPNFTIDVFHYDGFVYFWFAQTGSFQTYTLKLISPMADHVISQVSNAAKPVSGVTNSVTITPAKLWNSLNDGAGSGLDADTLDGQQLSSIVSGTTNYVSKFTGTNAIGNSQIFDNGTGVGIGTTSPVARLHVKGSGNTSATYGINLEDSAGVHVFRVRDDGGIHVGPTTNSTNGAFISSSDGTDNIGTTSLSGIRFRSALTTSGTGSDHYFRNYQGSRTQTSGTANLMEFNGGFAPTSGTGVYNFARVVGTVNQTGGANGITRGIWVSPTLTAAADFRAIETENGPWRLTDTYAAGSGSLAGSAFVINQTWNTTGTPTAISLNVTDTASNANSLLFRLQTGGITQFSVRKDGRVDFKNNSIVDQNGSAFFASLVINNGKADFSGTYLANTIQIKSTFAYAWNSGDANTSSVDLFLYRDAANTLAQRNGVNAQVLRVYNTFTDASNYERAKIAWESNVLRIGTENAGAGSARAFELQTNGLTQLTIAANGIITTTNGFNVGSSANSITNASANGTGTERVFACSQAYAAAAGSRIIFSSTNSVQPASGTLTYTGVGISPTINQTGGANGITRGIHINPTLTAAADWRAIEITAGKTIVAPSTTTSASLNIPSGTAPTSPVDGDIWFDGTALKVRIGGLTRTVTVT